jgi:hypothetical protein
MPIHLPFSFVDRIVINLPLAVYCLLKYRLPLKVVRRCYASIHPLGGDSPDDNSFHFENHQIVPSDCGDKFLTVVVAFKEVELL